MVILIGPVVARVGTMTLSCVSVTLTTTDSSPLNLTKFEPGFKASKFAPVMVTAVPIGPDVGVKPVIVGLAPMTLI